MFMPAVCSAIIKLVIHEPMRIGSIIASVMTALSASLSDAGSTPVMSMP